MQSESGIRYDKQVRIDRNLNIYLVLGTLGTSGLLGTLGTGHATRGNCGIAGSINEKK